MYEWGGGTALQLAWRPPGQGGFSYPPTTNLSTLPPDLIAPSLSGVGIASDNTNNTTKEKKLTNTKKN